MAQKRTIAFLIKIGPVFFGLLWLWHSAGMSHAYHAALATVLDWLYPALDRTAVVQGVGLEGHDVVLRLLVGETKTGLAINAGDITSSFAMLAALYLSSPIMPWRRFVVFFTGALVVLFVIHAVTTVTFSQEAFIGHPEIRSVVGYSPRQASLLIHYNVFFEEIGMYLYALVLWFPYILLALRPDGKEKGRPR